MRADEIRLGISGVTRAVVDDDLESLQAIGGAIGIYGVKTPGHTSAVGADWSSTPFDDDVADGGTLIMPNVQTSSIDDNKAIHWAGQYYYPLDDAAGVKFCAYHPYAAEGTSGANFVIAPAVGQAPVLNFTLTGSEDVMYATPAMGWRDKTDATTLTFHHILTQLTFVLIDEEKNFEGKTVNGISIQDANTSAKMNIETGEVSDWGTPAAVSVPDSQGVAFTADAVPADENTPAKGQAIGSAVMLQPGQTSFKVTVEIDGTKYENITIRPKSPATAFEVGKSYKITLTFKQKTEIGVGAAVTPWELGGEGFAEVL